MFGQTPFRLEPGAGAQHYKTYSILQPKSTHTRVVRCEDVECAAYQHGWKTTLDVSTSLGTQQAQFITRRSGRKYTLEQTGSQLTFTFPQGQQCFSEHRVKVDRPALYVVRGGDHRGNPAGIRPVQHTSPDNWVDDFANHQQRVADARKRG